VNLLFLKSWVGTVGERVFAFENFVGIPESLWSSEIGETRINANSCPGCYEEKLG
jgi:hypothetical protein